MIHLRLVTTVTAFAIGAGAAFAQTSDLPPERAPAAQQVAPPAKIAPPIDAGEQKSGAKPETTGQAPKPGPTADDNKASKSSPEKDPATDTHGNETLPRM